MLHEKPPGESLAQISFHHAIAKAILQAICSPVYDQFAPPGLPPLRLRPARLSARFCFCALSRSDQSTSRLYPFRHSITPRRAVSQILRKYKKPQSSIWHQSSCCRTAAPIPNRCRKPWRRQKHMLWTIFVILLVLWLLGVVSSYTLGGFIHVLLVIAVVVLLIQLISGRRPVV